MGHTSPRYGQYLTHAHSHITRPVAAMDSCFVLVRTPKHGFRVVQASDGFAMLLSPCTFLKVDIPFATP